MGNTHSVLFDVLGEYPVFPKIRVKPTGTRAAPTADVGWTFRRREKVTNTGIEPVANFPFLLSLGDTTPLTTTKAQADGDDLRLWHNGREIARTLKGWDSAASGAWVRIPYLGSGEEIVFDIVYGNASAVSPPTLTAGVDLPAFDVATSTNALWVYLTERIAANANKGGWPTVAGDPVFAVPAAWLLATTMQGDDDRWQESVSSYVDTLVTYQQGRFEARRSRAGTLETTRANGADGLVLKVPVGIEAVEADIVWTNQAVGDTDATPVGRVVILTRNSQGEPWKVLFEDATLEATEATIAAATHTPAAPVKEIAFAVWPQSGNSVSNAARPDRYINGGWGDTLEVAIDDSVLVQSTVQAETAIYELATELRNQGGGEAAGVPPYRSIYLGNAKSASGAGTPRMACEINQEVNVFTETRKVEVWNSGSTAKVEDVPIRAYEAVDGVRDATGATVERVSAEWITFVPTTPPVDNESFATDLTGWTQDNIANVTEVSSRDATVFHSTPASHKVVLSASSVGLGLVTARWYESAFLPVAGRGAIQVSAAFRVSNANLRPRLFVEWFNAAQGSIGKDVAPDWTPVISVFARRVFAARAPETAVYYRFGHEVYTGAANATGDVYDDTWAVNDSEVVLRDVAAGAITLSAEWYPRYA